MNSRESGTSRSGARGEPYTRLSVAESPGKEELQIVVNGIRHLCAECPTQYGTWPGLPEGSAVVSRYPNLAEELFLPVLMTDIGLVSRVSGVRPLTITRALESGEKLTARQLERLAAALHVSVEYLADPMLAAVDPNTVVGANQTIRLGALLEETRGLIVPLNATAIHILEVLKAGGMWPYSGYRLVTSVLLAAKRHPLRDTGKAAPVVYTLPVGEAVQRGPPTFLAP